jgi:peptidoglycan/xylan/chitin deacetylase (PgdA/CDA1 family)
MQKGIFTISLDHELHWGVSAHRTVESYRANLDNERAAISAMLDLFKKYEIHVTWAIVGMLFCRDKNELMQWFSKIDYPEYENKKLSNLELAKKEVGFNEKDDPYHFGYDTISWILSVPHQEIGTHTFSHYYCIENGQTISNFESDLQAALEIGMQHQLHKKSIVYPRNQYRQEHLDSSFRAGISCFRGVQNRRMYHFQSVETRKRRALRLIDSYFRISGDNTHLLGQHQGEKIYNVPSSRFFRPYDPRFALVEKRRLARITNEMTYAAKKKRLYHLWWHPHNFGANMQKNLQNLEYILQHYSRLKDLYGFESMNMTEICEYFRA